MRKIFVLMLAALILVAGGAKPAFAEARETAAPDLDLNMLTITLGDLAGRTKPPRLAMAQSAGFGAMRWSAPAREGCAQAPDVSPIHAPRSPGR